MDIRDIFTVVTCMLFRGYIQFYGPKNLKMIAKCEHDDLLVKDTQVCTHHALQQIFLMRPNPKVIPT